ncbi:MAG: SUF system NifU family Fe-S cluster assembly protein [Propionibacteriaceae bacterium]|jgi:nitrogen fixation NifU-like protein|nr:SUF system NifU family Fe-S cluster assembly protein [Propionibacteriaceae bacterium]
MTDLQSLYRDIILDHYRTPEYAGLREPYDVEVTHINPSCGDELVLRIAMESGEIHDISYQAEGCSISQASMSVAAGLLINTRPDQAFKLYDGFLAMLEGQGAIELDEDTYGDAIAFQGVAQFPARVKCALLGWAALRDAIIRTQGVKDD